MVETNYDELKFFVKYRGWIYGFKTAEEAIAKGRELGKTDGYPYGCGHLFEGKCDKDNVYPNEPVGKPISKGE